MELDELEKAWESWEETLQEKEIIDPDSLRELIARKSSSANSGIRKLRKYHIVLILFSLVGISLLGIYIINQERLGDMKWLYGVIFLITIPVFLWDLYTTHYLSRTRIDRMPLSTVIRRINTYNYWIIQERLVALGLLIIIAVSQFFLTRVWENDLVTQLTFFLVWGALF
ncbi:MAG: hypothetical protein LUD15_06010 [Bacteroides sp.]|nr:hypothetical protein [Bacteroides sp.]